MVISESSSWVFLDDFSGLAAIPLDEYPNRVSSFDPRNDGYADRVRSFFVRGGKRFFYLPRGRSPGGAGRLEKRLHASLGDIPFQLEYPGRRKPVFLYFSLLVIAGAGSVCLSRRLFFIPALPALAGLSFAGGPGIALSAVLMGLGGLLLAPCREYFIRRRYIKDGAPFGAYKRRSLGETLVPFRNRLFLAPVFAAALVGGAFFGRVHPLLLLGAGAGFTGLFLFSQWVFSRRGEAQDHIRFDPAPIFSVRALDPGFSRLMLPYALAALVSIPLPFVFSGPAPAENSFFLETMPPLLKEAEYRSHAAFQAFFSLRPLGWARDEEKQTPAYLRYTLGADGLIAGEAVPEENLVMEDLPPFPLADLMEALDFGKYSVSGGGAASVPEELAAVFIALLLSLPLLARTRRGDKKGKNRLSYKPVPKLVIL
jgi:hypothetical protein